MFPRKRSLVGFIPSQRLQNRLSCETEEPCTTATCDYQSPRLYGVTLRATRAFLITGAFQCIEVAMRKTTFVILLVAGAVNE